MLHFRIFLALVLTCFGRIATADSLAFDWFLAGAGLSDYQAKPAAGPGLESSSQGYGDLTLNASCHTHTPLRIGEKTYQEGLGTHAGSQIVFRTEALFKTFVAEVGIDSNEDTRRGAATASAVFVVKADGRELARTPTCRRGEPPRHIEVPIDNVRRLELVVTDAGDGTAFDQSDWADARLICGDGKSVSLTDLVRASQGCPLVNQTYLPASFVYGGQPSETLLTTWLRTERPSVEKDGRRVYEIVWQEPDDGLTATWHVEVLLDRPAAEFRWVFASGGKKAAKPLTEVCALDLRAGGVSRSRLVHCGGGMSGPLNAEPNTFLLSDAEPVNKAITLAAAGGRSSNKDLPFFVLHHDASQSGIFVGIGWSGQWQADFRPDTAKKTLRVTAGMPGMNLALPAGATIRSPGILLGLYCGDPQDGCNALRRTLYDHYVARLGDQKPMPPVSWNSWFTFDNRISEAMLKKQADAAAGLGLEYFCIDAGWFDGDFPKGVGNWTINRTKFPQGLAPIGKYVAERGMKLGLWFEPGRAEPDTRLAREHTDWVAGSQVKLEIPEARGWIFQMMSGFIDEGHVRWIRYDYNFDPLAAWDRSDAPDTRGLTQIRYLEGEYELLDRLRAKYPDLLIESCSSGGRRIDLETMRRAHTYWKSDETSSLIEARWQETAGNYFLPGGLLNTNLPASSPASAFDLHNLFAGPLGFATDWPRLDASARERVRQEIAAYKTIRHLLNKDYYPLFPQTRDLGQWVGWEFNDPGAGEGFVVVLRPVQSAYASAALKIRGVDENKMYKVSQIDGNEARSIPGRELSASLTVPLSLGESKVLRFQRQ